MSIIGDSTVDLNVLQSPDCTTTDTEILPEDKSQSESPIGGPSNVNRNEQINGKSSGNVVAVFIVKFDAYHGNIIEWQYPETFDLNNVEYQAICSGLHRVDSDLILFSRPPYFGLSAFKKVPIESDRGACMKAVGIIVKPDGNACGKVWRHSPYLQKQVDRCMDGSGDEEGLHKSLKEYYNSHQSNTEQGDPEGPPRNPSQDYSWPSLNTSKKVSISGEFKDDDMCAESLNSILENYAHNVAVATDTLSCVFNEQDTLHPALGFPAFVKQFGPSIFILWKAVLLRKRIIFMTDPPMSHACQLVFNTCLLGSLSHMPDNIVKEDSLQGPIPRFASGVNDITDLENSQGNYVICTSDTIFKSKLDLYDVLVTLPAPSFTSSSHINGRSDETDSASNSQGHSSSFALADLNSHPEIRVTGNFIPAHSNPADHTRFCILWHAFQVAEGARQSTDSSMATQAALTTLLASQEQTVTNWFDTLVWKGCLWWYKNATINTSSDIPKGSTHSDDGCGQTGSSWQKVFGGVGSRKDYGRRSRKGKLFRNEVAMDSVEQQELLLGRDGASLMDDEQDAQAIHADFFDVVAARMSLDTPATQNQGVVEGQSVTTEERENEKIAGGLVEFFHLLSSQLLLMLNTILLANEDGLEDTILYPQDMLHLGLDPQSDGEFVCELAQLYFGKQIRVAGCFELGVCCKGLGSCCNPRTRGSIRI
ncbi:hypothetical protein F4703DRAFT_1894180 [Phycomyces blakesleeanus]